MTAVHSLPTGVDMEIEVVGVGQMLGRTILPTDLDADAQGNELTIVAISP